MIGNQHSNVHLKCYTQTITTIFTSYGSEQQQEKLQEKEPKGI